MKKYLFLLLLLFTGVTGFYFFWSWSQLPEGHRFIYPLDDAYIHLALARNFAEFGVWSVNTDGFDSASSSVLYTLILSFLIKIFGDWEFYPLLLNILFGYLTVFWVYKYFRDFYGKNELKLALFLLLPFTMIYWMVLIGMEHTLHLFLMVLAIYTIKKNLQSNFSGIDFQKLLVITFFISLVRFESMFFTLSLALALFLRKNFRRGIWILIVGFIPILIFGLISIKNGGFFFPNSVMMKGNFPSEQHFITSIWIIFKNGILLNSSFYKCLLFPFILISIYLIRKYKHENSVNFFKNETLIIVIVLVAILQSLFAVLKLRYENYVMISVLLVVIPLIAEFYKGSNFKKIKFSDFLMLFSIVGIFGFSIYRFYYHHSILKVASKNITEQQVEISRFLHRFYGGEKVVANDIGAVSYFGNVKVLDLAGLGSTDIARFISDEKNRSELQDDLEFQEFLKKYTTQNHYKLAVIYPEWLHGKIPQNWIPVASWKISENRVASKSRVVFYVLSKNDIIVLQRNLLKFNLNKNVEQWFYIVKR